MNLLGLSSSQFTFVFVMSLIMDLSVCLGIPVWLLVTQSPTQQEWMFSPNSLLTSRTQILRPMKVSGSNISKSKVSFQSFTVFIQTLFIVLFLAVFSVTSAGQKTSRERPC